MIGRKWKIGALALLTTMAMAGALSGSLAWFNDYAILPEERMEGSLRGAYFAYGDGSEENPYGITIPRHLYNLAWLQYSGFFNKDANNDNVIDKTFYFELSDEIENGVLDMTGYTLPPIGTEEYPFIGEFNGNGNVVTNLDVSNNFAAFGTNHPTTVTSTSFAAKQPQIVGFFGVVGTLPDQTYTYDNSANCIFDTGLTNINVSTVTTSSLIGVVAGYVNGDISGVAVDASEANISAANTTSLSYTDNLSDYGVVGHVAKEKEGMKNQITRVDETIYDLNISSVHEFNANDQGDTQGFGGSIDMKKLYNDIVTNVWEECTDNTIGAGNYGTDKHVAQYSTAATKLIAQDGTEGQIVFDNNSLSPSTGNDGFKIKGTENDYFPSGPDTNRRYYNYSIQDNSKDTSSFGLIVETENRYGISSEKRFMCLSGERDIAVENGATLNSSYEVSVSGRYLYYVANNGTRNYLNDDFSGSPTNVTAANDASSTASLWSFVNGSISTIDFTVSTDSNTVRRYLNCTSPYTLTISGSNSSTWVKDANGYYVTLSGNKYYLGFDGTKWTTTRYRNAAETELYYLIHSGNNYMTHSDPVTGSGTVGNINSATAPTSNNARWYWFAATGSTGYFSATETGTPYFLIHASSNRVNYEAVTSNRFIASGNSGTVTFSDGSGRTAYRLRYNNGWSWVQQRNTIGLTVNRISNDYPAGFETNIHSADITLSAQDISRTPNTRETTIDSAVHTFPTYMPLTNKKTTDGTTPTEIFGVPDPYNTGYIVSGAKYRGDPYGDIRVSEYPSSNISDLRTSSGVISTVYTVNARGYQQTVADNYSETYKASREQLQTNVLKGSSNIYGLHFMDAAISSDQTASADTDPEYSAHQAHNVGHSAFVGRAVINKETFDNYELPTDCIDFNLKEKGYINFFAGTYYTGNNSFFSLYEVVRDANERIIQLREISEIYSDSQVPNSYQYKYASGKYSVPFKFVNSVKKTLDGGAYTEHSLQDEARSGYASVFKTDWIKGVSANTSGGDDSILENAAYYFEIPMNDGEYALGSVSGKNGAYLMYLDIGANAAKVYRTVISEHFKTDESTMEYPLGIAILTSPSSITSSMKEGKEEHIELVCVEIAENYRGTLRIARGRDANNASTSQINVTGNSPGLADPVFQGDGVELNIAAQLVPKSHTTKDIKRIQYYDYGVNTQETTRVVITFTSTNGGAYARDIKCYDANDEEITDQSKWKIFRTDGGTKFLNLNEITYSNLTGTTGDGLFYTEVGTTDNDILLKARYWEDVATGESAYVLTLSKTTDANAKQTFVFQDYELEVTATGGSLTVEVLKKGSKTIMIGETTVTAVGQTIVINP